MNGDEYAARFPVLFAPTRWEWGPLEVQFSLLDAAPPEHLIANVNVVPFIGDQVVVIYIGGSSPEWTIPGGTLEAGEAYSAAIQREMLEEVGARVISFYPLGAWFCHSLQDKPYRPHLPWPDSYRYVVYGDVELIAAPTNPADGEQVQRVEVLTLADAAQRFREQGRADLAELYALSGLVRAARGT